MASCVYNLCAGGLLQKWNASKGEARMGKRSKIETNVNYLQVDELPGNQAEASVEGCLEAIMLCLTGDLQLCQVDTVSTRCTA